ncbi:MAG: threonylcarbamoyl-AMP synthase [Deltaproteobacteria bacterium]|nr:MAG: threonylcarbamoyl-AMP synthase [Deltaproteobacteria bacterium]
MKTIEIDSTNPRPDLLNAAVSTLREGSLAVVATDTAWSIVGDPFQTATVQRLARLRERHAGSQEESKRKAAQPMSLLFGEVADCGRYVLLDQPQFRFLRRLLPGPYTMLLPASREVPRLLQTRRKAVGVRVPDHPVCNMLLRLLGAPLTACTARAQDGEILLSGTDIEQALDRDVALFIETEPFLPEPSTVIDYTGDSPILLRAGKGPIEDDWLAP